METRIRRKLSMAKRVLQFSRANPSDDAGYAAVVDRLAAQIAEAERLTDLERESTVDEQGAILRRQAMRRKLRIMTRHIGRVAELVVAEHPELAGEFAAPRPRSTNRTFLSDARVLFNKATAQKELFAALGLGATLLVEMEQALKAFEESGAVATDNRDGHRQAREQIMQTVLECTRLVGVLDSFNRARYAEQPGLLSTWDGVRDVYGRSTRPTAEAEGDGVTGTIPPAPVEPPEIQEEAA